MVRKYVNSNEKWCIPEPKWIGGSEQMTALCTRYPVALTFLFSNQPAFMNGRFQVAQWKHAHASVFA